MQPIYGPKPKARGWVKLGSLAPKAKARGWVKLQLGKLTRVCPKARARKSSKARGYS